MTRIKYERTGGFMARKVSFSFNLDKLPVDQAQSIRQLLDETDFFNLPENLITTPMPDEFTYIITVEVKTRRHSVRTSDTTAPDSLRSLLDDLSQLARSARFK